MNRKFKKGFSWVLTVGMLAGALPYSPMTLKADIVLPEIGLEANSQPSPITTSSIYYDQPDRTTSSAYNIANFKGQPIIFGDGINKVDNTITINNNTLIMESTNNKGKISSSKDGIAFYYTESDVQENFEVKVKARVEHFDKNNQVSFGIMLRDTIGEDGQTGTDEIKGSRMLGVGGLTQKMIAFNRAKEKAGFETISILEDALPITGNEYELVIKKSGNTYELICNGESVVKEDLESFTDEIYVGVYTARNTKVVYSDLSFNKIEAINDLTLASQPDKTEYLLGEALDLSGLAVTAEGKTIPHDQLIISGFDSETVGIKEITISYAGKEINFNLEVIDLTCVELKVSPTPAKTTYYINDKFDPTGMTIKAKFNSGEERNLEEEEYLVSAPDMAISGEQTVKVHYNGQSASGVEDEFNITILPDRLMGLKVVKEPIKTQYYIGETLELKGLVVKAMYENEEVLLMMDEYTIDTSKFDTQTPGEKVVRITYKDQAVDIIVSVKVREVVGIEVTTLPQTTYEIGQAFSADGIGIAKVYDNGDKEIIDSSEYILDSTAFDSSQEGTCSISIHPVDATIKPISFEVSVREKVAYKWNSISFGQSISLDKNFVEVEQPGTTEGTVKLTALEGGGKITNSFQDGITFYYTEIDSTKDNFELSADIKVIEFAKPTPDNQEGFGIMARDAIGVNGDSSVFYSNIAAVGGYRGKTHMVMRSGVTASDSSGAANGVQQEIVLDNARPAENNTYPQKDYRLTLKKTNSGYVGQINDGEEVLCFAPDALGIQNDKVYVGFYAARLATIEVSNIEFKVTDATTDAPKVEPPKQPVTPAFSIASLNTSSTEAYDLKLYSNVNGTVTIKQGETVIARDKEIQAGEMLTQNTQLEWDTVTPFTVTFIPDTAEDLTSYEKIVKTLFVTMKTYGTEGEAIYVAPTGSKQGTGSLESPLDMNTAIQFVRPGQTIYMLEGTYTLTEAMGVQLGNNGTADKVKVLAAYPGSKVTIDANNKVSGFNLDGDYWHIFGLDFTGAISTGFRVGGNNNVVELCNFYENGDTGLQISRYGNGGYETWPANNLILNCTSYDNIDKSENNADGFAAKLTCGPGNVFKGCISHNNIDDAWDLFAKGSTGPIGAVMLEDCIAYENGTLTNGYVGKGDKNGFKLGGEGIAVPHTIKNSIAFNNGATGFSSNSNPAVISENCVSYDNEGANFDWRVYTDVVPQFQAKGNVSYRSTKGTKDVYPASLKSKDNYYYDGEKSVNSEGIVLTDENFVSLEAPEVGYKRDEKGNIIFGDFLKFIAPKDKDEETSKPDDNESSDSNQSNNKEEISKEKNDNVEITHTIIISLLTNQVTSNNQELTLSMAPYLERGRMMAGMRDLSALLGISDDAIIWEHSSKTMSIKDRDISLKVGKSYAVVKGEKVDLGIETKIVNDRLVVPVAHICRVLGMNVKFDERTKEVTITR